MIPRLSYAESVKKALARSPICGLMGPRQSGKSTLAREIAGPIGGHFFDLESPRDQVRLQNPELALGRLSGVVVLDEIQTRPDLFPVLRVLADRPDTPARFLILGSASPELVARSAESLAGRIEYVDLLVFDHGRRTGYEFKYAEQPRVTRSMRAAMEDLRLDLLMVICPGTVRAQLAPGVEAMGIESFASGTPP